MNDLGDRSRLAAGHVRIEGAEIAEVVPGELPAEADCGGPHALVAPGFIDAHVHLPQFDMIGAHGLPLLEWLNNVTFPNEKLWEDTAYARSMTERVLARLFAHGTTAISAYSTVHAAATREALRVADKLGMRGVIGQTLSERHAPDDMCRPADALIDDTQRLLEAFSPGRRMAAAVTPRFAVTCGEALLASAAALAREHNAHVQTHLAETTAESALVADLFGGASYTEVYQRAGLLSPRAILGHGVHLDGRDRAVLREAGAVVAHCPTANSFLRAGAMDRRAALLDGVKVALGSDVGAGYEISMVRVARAMIETAAAIGDSFPVAAQGWWQITAGNAQALGWTDAGHLHGGCPADLILIEPDTPWLSSGVDPLSALMFSWDDRWLKRTWALGRLVYSANWPCGPQCTITG